MDEPESEESLRDYVEEQSGAIKSYRRKIERKCKKHISNDDAASSWVEEHLADYFRKHYHHQSDFDL